MFRYICMIFIVLSLSCEVNAQDLPDNRKFDDIEKTLKQHPNLAEWYLFARCSSHITVASFIGKIDEETRESYRSVALRFLEKSVKVYMKQQGLSLNNKESFESVADNIINFISSLDKQYARDLGDKISRYGEGAQEHSILAIDTSFCSNLVIALD